MWRRVCVEEGVCGGGCVWRRVCVEEGVCGGGCVWRRVCVEEGVCGGGCVWRRVCVEEGVCGGGFVCGECVWRVCEEVQGQATANDLQSLVANKAEVSKGVAEVGAVPEKRRSGPKARPLGDQERGARVCSHCGQAHKSRP